MAKKFGLILLIPLFAQAHIAISIEKPTPNGLIQAAYLFKDKEANFVTNTNYFKSTDQRLGRFKIENTSDLETEKNELKKIITIFNKASAKFAPTKDLKTNGFQHEAYIRLNDITIRPENPLFDRTMKVLKKLTSSVKLSPVKGANVQVKLNEKSLYISKTGRKPPLILDKEKVCDKKVCTINQIGIFFLE